MEQGTLLGMASYLLTVLWLTPYWTGLSLPLSQGSCKEVRWLHD
uniref:Uncharacterized protein n=1 Tax=Nelumbo nucifera TaxID=4432 RepID=A0A822YYS7_NELNU|nr:TPA_asm: hypothetical protein HUJ06_007060 [Nelumbo nucifera]